MKNRFITKAMGVVLAATVAFTGIPVNAQAGQAEQTTETAEAAETTEAAEIPAATGAPEDAPVYDDDIDIFTFDWKTASTDEINDAVYAADFVDLGNWLSAMPEDERQELLKKDTYLHNKVQVLSADPAGNGYNEVSGNEDPELWEFSMAQMETGEDVSVQTADADDGIAVQSADDAIDAVGAGTISNCSGYHFGKGSGYYTLVFHIVNADGSNTDYVYKMAVSGVSKTADIVLESDEVNLALVIPSGVPSWLNFSMNKGVTSTTEKLKRPASWTNSGNGYQTLQDYFKFTKPVGYVCEATTGGGGMKYSNLFYNDSDNYATSRQVFTGSANSTASETYALRACVDLLDTGISIVDCNGKTKYASYGASCYAFWLRPISYTVGYHPNGATGGSVPAQSYVYGQTYTPSGNAYNRTYAMTYNANRGNASKVSENVSYDFLGWGWENTGVVTHTPSTAFANLTSVNGGYAGTFYAVWQPKSTVLPTANRTGYKFAGWISHADGKTYGGGTAFTPVCDTQMTAQWQANTYTLKFNSNGGTECKDMTATYDTELTLPTPERTGYTFAGWSGAGGTYSGVVKNLTSVANDTVTLTALWENKTDIPYKVIHRVQEAPGSKNFIVQEVEERYGTVGETVTPPVKNFDTDERKYSAPALESKQIAADGSTEFVYNYKIIQNNTSYRVEHYLQDRTDRTKYNLDEANTVKGDGEAGTSITPDVITSYEGYDTPAPQTVTLAADGSTVVKYYYNLSAEKSTVNNSYLETDENNNGADANNFKSGDVQYYIDKYGNIYKILVNPDGTFTVQSIKTAGSSKENLSISSTITINGVKYTVTEIAPYAFKGNSKLKTVKIGSGIKKIGKGAFMNCKNLKKVSFGTSLSIIDAQAFSGCKNLTTVKTNKALTKIGAKAFYNCRKLKSYTIGKYVQTIGSSAFQNCTSLKNMTISESVEIIRKKAFFGCSKLKNVRIRSEKLCKVEKDAFKKCKKPVHFTVPKKKEKTYKKLLKGRY